LLARFAARAVPFTTASDAHGLERVADRADDLREVLRTAGVDRLVAFSDRRPRTVPVSPAPASSLPEGPH
jgi:hypothetical protein